jgi:hypothetical protein
MIVSRYHRARQTCFCGLLRVRLIVARRTRAAAVTVMEIPLRITDTRTKPNLQKLLFGLFCQVLSTNAPGPFVGNLIDASQPDACQCSAER